MNKAINWRGILLMPNSEAFNLHQSGELKKLELHMKRLHKEMQDRGECK